MKNVLGYIRVSTTNQVKDGYSLEEQREEIEKYCENNKLNLIDIYEDCGKVVPKQTRKKHALKEMA